MKIRAYSAIITHNIFPFYFLTARGSMNIPVWRWLFLKFQPKRSYLYRLLETRTPIGLAYYLIQIDGKDFEPTRVGFASNCQSARLNIIAILQC